ncbi:MAG: hypothetical protein JNL83_36970 [Myxococcales bacterium]|nr:hypothetical protein [Myxococcales bacterium]
MTARTIWMPEVRAVLSQLTGTVDVAGVERWIAALDAELAKIPAGTEIVLLSDLYGYEPADLEAHKRMRDVIPTRLAAMGFRTGLADAVGAAIEIAAAPRVVCSKVAHVHHDATKMAAYEAAHASPRERFFTSAAFANEWILFD